MQSSRVKVLNICESFPQAMHTHRLSRAKPGRPCQRCDNSIVSPCAVLPQAIRNALDSQRTVDVLLEALNLTVASDPAFVLEAHRDVLKTRLRQTLLAAFGRKLLLHLRCHIARLRCEGRSQCRGPVLSVRFVSRSARVATAGNSRCAAAGADLHPERHLLSACVANRRIESCQGDSCTVSVSSVGLSCARGHSDISYPS